MYPTVMSIMLPLADAVRQIELTLAGIDDPVDRLIQADAVRADLAVLLTETVRRCAFQAYEAGEIPRMATQSWRGSRYLYRLSVDHRRNHDIPKVDRLVKDITSRHLLDLNDLARLRGSSR